MFDTLYYDGKCPLCSHEIRLLKKFKSTSLILIDIHGDDNQQTIFSPQTLLSVLHLQAHDGEWVTGLDATVQAWSHTKFGFLLLPLRWPLIKQLSDWLYQIWARKRKCHI